MIIQYLKVLKVYLTTYTGCTYTHKDVISQISHSVIHLQGTYTELDAVQPWKWSA